MSVVWLYIMELYKKSCFPQIPKLTTDTTNVCRAAETWEQSKRGKRNSYFPNQEKRTLVWQVEMLNLRLRARPTYHLLCAS